jgi:hypothetical protein
MLLNHVAELRVDLCKFLNCGDYTEMNVGLQRLKLCKPLPKKEFYKKH